MAPSGAGPGRIGSVTVVHDAEASGRGLASGRRIAEAAGVTVRVLELDRGTGSPAVESGSRVRHEWVDAWPPPGRAIAARIDREPGAVVVIEARGGGPAADPLVDEVAESVLQHVRLPTLVLGPHAPALDPAAPLVVAVDADADGALVPVAGAWLATLTGARAVVTCLSAPDPWPADASEPVTDEARRLAGLLRHAAPATELERRPTTVPAVALMDALDEHHGGVVVVAAPRWPDDRSHWYSTSRRLIRGAAAGVLVVPSDAGTTGAGPGGSEAGASRLAPRRR